MTPTRHSNSIVLAATVDVTLDAFSISLLEASETKRLESFRNSEDARRFAAGRILMRSVITAVIDEETGQKPFAYGKYGKPYMPDAGTLDFNISHCGPWAAIGISFNGVIGVDIERQQPLAVWHEIAAEFLTPSDLLVPENLSNPDQLLKRWTAKEAILKAKGTGLTISPNTVCITPELETFVAVMDTYPFQGAWKALDATHLLAIATEKNRPEIMVAGDCQKLRSAVLGTSVLKGVAEVP